jgi:hypothetical protein
MAGRCSFGLRSKNSSHEGQGGSNGDGGGEGNDGNSSDGNSSDGNSSDVVAKATMAIVVIASENRGGLVGFLGRGGKKKKKRGDHFE